MVAALKSAGVAATDGGGILSANGGLNSVGASDSVVVAQNTNGTGKGGEDEGNSSEGANEHLGLTSRGNLKGSEVGSGTEDSFNWGIRFEHRCPLVYEKY